jgi:hypothetical protein
MNDTKPDNPDAFPIVKLGDESYVVETGMTLRDYFAAKALQGAMSNFKLLEGIAKELHGDLEVELPKKLAADVYKVADAMLAERSKP